MIKNWTHLKSIILKAKKILASIMWIIPSQERV